MSDYPKVLYKGDHYEDWQAVCEALKMKFIQSVTVTSKEEEDERISEGYGHISFLMKRPILKMKNGNASK